MEYLDVINDQDLIIGKEERDVVHSKHLLHRSVHILISNSQNEILLQLRKSTKKQYPLYWSSSVGGHVSSGESALEAAHKELREELGIDADLQFVSKFVIDNEVEHEMVNVFFAKNDGPFSLEKSEMEKVEFFPVNELKKHALHMTPHCIKAIDLIINKDLLKL